MNVTTANSSHDHSLHPARFSDAQREVGRRLTWLHAAAALFMGIQAIAYGAVGASATVKPSVGFPTRCEGERQEMVNYTIGILAISHDPSPRQQGLSVNQL